MKIALVTLGTRGDVQPYVAIGCALEARGHRVTIATHREFEPLIRAYGLAFKPLRANFGELCQTDAGRAWLTSGDSPREYRKWVRILLGELQQGWCEDADAAVEGADAVVFYMMAVGALYAAERRGLPAMFLAPWPAIPTGAFVPTGPQLGWLPGFVKRAAGHAILRFVGRAFRDEHAKYRARVGLPPSRASDPFHHVLDSGIGSVGLFSESVLPRPYDWDVRHEVAGFAFAPTRAYEPPPALARFLEAGPKPIYIGFGSMTGFEPAALARIAIEAAQRAGVRVILSSGWAGLGADANDVVHGVGDVPHDWLFPRVAAVVHHGGVGTFAEGLRAGRPTVIAAFFGDQPFWGWRNEQLGTGPRTLTRKRLNAETLGRAIEQAVTIEGYRLRAEEIGATLRAESGAERAAAMIERRFAAELQGRAARG